MLLSTKRCGFNYFYKRLNASLKIASVNGKKKRIRDVFEAYFFGSFFFFFYSFEEREYTSTFFFFISYYYYIKQQSECRSTPKRLYQVYFLLLEYVDIVFYIFILFLSFTCFILKDPFSPSTRAARRFAGRVPEIRRVSPPLPTSSYNIRVYNIRRII